MGRLIPLVPVEIGFDEIVIKVDLPLFGFLFRGRLHLTCT